MGRTSGTSIRSGTLTVSPGRSAGSAAPHQEHGSGRCSTTSSAVSLITRPWPSCPGLAPPGLERSRCSFRSVEGGLEEVREVLLRPLQAQHQLDQLFLAQTLKLNTTHATLESAKTANLKSVGN